MIEIKDFCNRLEHPCGSYQKYDRQCFGFYKYKIGVELSNGHILDKRHINETYNKIQPILSSWQTYRGISFTVPWKDTLRIALSNISNAYDKIRGINLIEINSLPWDYMKKIWHELGRVKKQDGTRSPQGYYYIIAVSKPLMLLWGQTPGFDENVRGNAKDLGINKERTWNFSDYKKALVTLSNELCSNAKIIDCSRKRAQKQLDTDSFVPFGRYLDCYYF